MASDADDDKGNAPDGALASVKKAVWYAAAPILGLAGLLTVSAWTLLSHTLDGDLLPLVSVPVLTGLAASASPFLDGGGDAAAASATSLTLSALISHTSPSWPRASSFGVVRLGALTFAVCYSIAAASRISGSSSTANNSRASASVALAIVFPLLDILRVLRLWRHANHHACAAAERRVLEKVLSHGRAEIHQGDAAGMHYVVVRKPQALQDPEVAARPPLVIVHGYMAGAALFLYQFDELADHFPAVYAVDWPGCGASPRPAFTAKDTDSAESWVTGPLEALRQTLGLERMVLVGHSMGGYFAAVYAMSHPSRVAHLCLVSPAGIPDTPIVDPNAAKGGMVKSDPKQPTPRRIPRWLWGTMSWLWNAGFTPGVGLRWMGPLGPTWVRKALGFRASRWVLERPLEPYAEDLADYLYHNIGGDGSGEYVLRHILAPGVWAKRPIAKRLAAAASLPPTHSQHYRVPTLWVYGGTHDWMSVEHGHAAAGQLRALGVRASCHTVSPGGHHVYLESPTEFNALIVREVTSALKEEVEGMAQAASGAVTHVGKGDAFSEMKGAASVPAVAGGR